MNTLLNFNIALFCVAGLLQNLHIEGYYFFLYLPARFKDQVTIAVVHCNAGIRRFLNDLEEGMVQKTLRPVDFRQFYHYTLLKL
jgi:hypothetical protein